MLDGHLKPSYVAGIWVAVGSAVAMLALFTSGCSTRASVDTSENSTTTTSDAVGAVEAETLDIDDGGLSSQAQDPEVDTGSSLDSSTIENDAANGTSPDHGAQVESDDEDVLGRHEHPQPSLTTEPSVPVVNGMEAAVVNSTAPPGSGGIWVPERGVSWQWQLSGEIDTSIDADVYDIDLFDVMEATIDELKGKNRIVVCYFSAGAWEDWRPDADDFEQSLLGESNGWPSERWLDIRRMDALKPIMEARLDLAASKGCDAVEPDNVDGYQAETGFPLTASDQIVFNSFLAEAAHERGLSVGLKNALELIGILEPQFDWALNEECMQYNECEAYKPFIDANKAVFHVEYSGNGSYCDKAKELGFSSLEKDEDVSSEYKPC